jgi:potassium-transporting ATPase KdpC subunit
MILPENFPKMKKEYLTALRFLLLMTILTGLLYPGLMTGLAQLIFPRKANGSLILKDGKIIGSEILGQKFDSCIYFWTRPSATDYGTIPSAASNLGPTSQVLKILVHKRITDFARKNGLTDTLAVPPEMIFASGSGLDPHISPVSAMLQVRRISEARNFDSVKTVQLKSVVKRLTEEPQFMIFGERRINVLELNIKLDEISSRNNSLIKGSGR